MRRLFPVAPFVLAFAAALPMAAKSGDEDAAARFGALAPAAEQALLAALGDPDPAVKHRLARTVGTGQLLAAFYGPSRSARLVALDAASGHLDDPLPVLPALAALMSARDRAVASRAAAALLDILHRGAELPGGFAESVPRQIASLAAQLTTVAVDERLDADLRASAIAGIGLLGSRDETPLRKELAALLEDDEAAIRSRALALVSVPVREEWLQAVADRAVGDPDLGIRGQAAVLLCENALQHGAAAPTDALKAVLRAVVDDKAVPADALAGVLVCLKRFPPEARGDLLERAVAAHPDPALRQIAEAAPAP